jgi:hypothetical protein
MDQQNMQFHILNRLNIDAHRLRIRRTISVTDFIKFLRILSEIDSHRTIHARRIGQGEGFN